MLRILPIIILLFISIACKDHASGVETFEGEDTPLNLFYGMSDWYNNKETYSDSILDNIPGLRHQEFFTDLCIPEDSIRYRNSLGIYIDVDYPSFVVRNSVISYLDSLICQGLSYNIEKDRLVHDLSEIESAEDYLNIWQEFYSNKEEISDKENHYPEVRGTRVCVVSHKVSSSENYATYLMESSFDYFGSCGCPSEADYITYNITTGKPLSIDEILTLYPVPNIENKLKEAYKKGTKERNFEPSENITGEWLLQEADGAAIINEGLLIYFKPYKIGCGAEGQYNLIIN